MKRLCYILLVALVLAGNVHILIVLLIPSYAAKDAWTQLAERGPPLEFTIISKPGDKQSVLPTTDPQFWTAACRFDLKAAPLTVEADGILPFWSVAIFDRRGRNIYSFNDRTSIERHLYLIVVNPVQVTQLRKNPPENSERAVIVQSDSQQGFVLIRALQTDRSWEPTLQKFLSGARCEPLEIELETDPVTEK